MAGVCGNGPSSARALKPRQQTQPIATTGNTTSSVSFPVTLGAVCQDFAVDFSASPMRWLVLRLQFSGAAGLSPDEAQQLAGYLASLSPFLGASAADARDPWLTLSRETLIVVEHQLRNHLNSLFMNAVVLGMRCEDRTDIEPILDQMESDAVGCLDQMRRLFPPPP